MIELDFLERLSSIIFDKQMLFKQENGRYYSKYHGCELELVEVEMWLLDNILEDYIKLTKLQNTKNW